MTDSLIFEAVLFIALVRSLRYLILILTAGMSARLGYITLSQGRRQWSMDDIKRALTLRATGALIITARSMEEGSTGNERSV